MFIFLVTTTVLIYWPSLFNGYLNWDDTTHYLENPYLHPLNFHNFLNIFSTDVNQTYIPLTELSFAIENFIFGYNPLVSHLINIFLHAGVTGLVFLCALAMGFTLPAAGLASLLFGIHPMHVESVTWVTGRKDVLYAFFYLFSLLWYLRWFHTGKQYYYTFSLLSGILSILAKPMALSLPLVLLVCDLYLKRKWSWRILWEKLPYFFYTIPIAGMTYFLNSRVVDFQWPQSVMTWFWCFIFYLRKFLFPGELNPLYSLPQPVAWTNVEYTIAMLLMIIAVGVWWKNRTNKIFNFAFLFYFGSIFFLLRLDNTADVHIVADRFMYLASFGICLLAADTAIKVYNRTAVKSLSRKMAFMLGGSIIAMLILLTVRQQFTWRDSVTLWSVVLNKNPASFLALTNRANAHLQRKNSDLAIADLEYSLRVNPTQALAFYNLVTTEKPSTLLVDDG